MSIFQKKQTARKAHSCWRCQNDIPPGQAYVRVSVTPGSEGNEEGGWLSLAEHENWNACEAAKPERSR